MRLNDIEKNMVFKDAVQQFMGINPDLIRLDQTHKDKIVQLGNDLCDTLLQFKKSFEPLEEVQVQPPVEKKKTLNDMKMEL